MIAAGALVAVACLPAPGLAAPPAHGLRASSTPPPGTTMVYLGPLGERDDIQRVRYDGVVVGANQGAALSPFFIPNPPPDAQITFEAENAFDAFSWNFALTRVAPDNSITMLFSESYSAAVPGRIGIVRRVVLTPDGEVIGQCGEALAALTCIPAVDADDDGVAAASDCDDSDQARRPGAPERPGNAIDENCDGRSEPFPRVGGSVRLRSIPLDDGRTRVASLAVRGVSPASTIRLACTGRGCGRLRRTAFRAPAGDDTVSLTRRVRRLRLAPGAKLSVRIAAPDRRTRVFTFTFRRRLAPTLLQRCANPGRSVLSAC